MSGLPSFSRIVSYIQTSNGIQSLIFYIQKALEKGDLPAEELRALESDVSSRVSRKPYCDVYIVDKFK